MTHSKHSETVETPAEEIVRLAARHMPGVKHSEFPIDETEWCGDSIEHWSGPARLKLECLLCVQKILKR